jgi:hypothetical protein
MIQLLSAPGNFLSLAIERWCGGAFLGAQLFTDAIYTEVSLVDNE